MNREHTLPLAHLELVALYVALSRQEEELDDHQKQVLEKVREELYLTLSVSEMEAIETYYAAISGV